MKVVIAATCSKTCVTLHYLNNFKLIIIIIIIIILIIINIDWCFYMYTSTSPIRS